MKVLVRRFLFKGNTLLSEEALTERLQDSAMRSLSFSQLQEAAEKVMQAYRDAGWLAYAYLPEQDVTAGELTIQVIESTMGELKLSGDFSKRIREAHIQRIIQAHQAPGEALRIQALDRALLLAGDLPGIHVQGALAEATADRPGRDLVLMASSQPMVVGEFSLDNTGARSTGPERAVVALNLNSPMAYGELASLSAMKSEGNTYVRADLNWPVGYNGWRVGLYDAYLGYQIVSPEFAATNAKGTSNTFGLSATYPVWRAATRSLYANFQAERKGFDNQANGGTETLYKSMALSFGLSGNLKDAWDGFSSGNLAWVTGLLNLNSSPNRQRDAAGAQTAGRFDKVRYTLSRQQPLAKDWSGYFGLSGQWASKNLDSSEKFTLGGDSGVRAYPGGEGTGAMGQLASVELRWQVLNLNTLVGFYDWGQVTQLAHNEGASALNTYALKGVGLSWMGQGPGGLRFKLTWARRIGANPNPTTTGTDQDGSLSRDRFWLSATVPFSH